MKHEKITDSLRQIAREEGITEEEVRNEIALAISYALKSNDPNIQNFWKDIPCEGDSPTVEEIVEYLIIALSGPKH